MIRVVHYINQFYGGIGGEEKADINRKSEKALLAPEWLLRLHWEPKLK